MADLARWLAGPAAQSGDAADRLAVLAAADGPPLSQARAD
jgi:hypothetical protein